MLACESLLLQLDMLDVPSPSFKPFGTVQAIGDTCRNQTTDRARDQ